MQKSIRRIAINIGGGYVPGLNAVITGTVTDQETYPLVLGGLVKGGPPTAVDRQLGLGYGAGAVQALNHGQTGGMVTFQPPDIKIVPLAEAINKVRTVPPDSMFMQIARSLGISFGDEVTK